MDACVVADWAADKRALFDAALPDIALTGPAGQAAGASLASPYSPAQARAPITSGESPQATVCNAQAVFL